VGGELGGVAMVSAAVLAGKSDEPRPEVKTEPPPEPKQQVVETTRGEPVKGTPKPAAGRVEKKAGRH
jgi:hypothetical protein